ncbi:MAG TPA: hypothetical protein VNG13_13335 [Mycobacteriales bacterium]|nr:hypothetical protein [Mycobacteriales bacterium]
MKRRDLLKHIRAAAQARQLELAQLREGANHTVYTLGRRQFTVPRHSEINEYTAEGIMKDLEDELGKDLWRR